MSFHVNLGEGETSTRPRNFVSLTPLHFLERSAEVYPERQGVKRSGLLGFHTDGDGLGVVRSEFGGLEVLARNSE